MGASTRDAEIQQRQWDDWIRLGDEWGEAGEHFRLCKQQGAVYPYFTHRFVALTHDEKVSRMPLRRLCSLCSRNSKS